MSRNQTVEVLCRRLQEAEEALHRLMIGEIEVTVSVVGYGATTYHAANRDQLEAYIARLQQRIDRLAGKARRGPLWMRF